jgi:hypothetical protein
LDYFSQPALLFVSLQELSGCLPELFVCVLHQPSDTRSCTGDGKKEVVDCWGSRTLTENSFSVLIAIDIPDSCQPNTTPIAWTRGVGTGGEWSSTNGVFGTKGGFIAFLDGKVKWFDNVVNKLMKYDMTTTVSKINSTLPLGCKIISGASMANTSYSVGHCVVW